MSHELPPASDQVLTIFVLQVTVVAALGGLLFGYDTAVISGAIHFLTQHFRLSPAETGWAASVALAGCAVGSAAAGMIGDALGRRMVLLLAAILFLVSALGTAMASSFSVFIAFRILAGAGVGAASIASPVYIAEMAPQRWRGWLVGTNQFAIVSGMLLIYFVNYRIMRLGSEAWNETSGWRWMFASGALPALILLVLLMTIPETPRFLLGRGRRAEAMRVAKKIGDETSALDEVEEVDAETRREEKLSLLTGAHGQVAIVGIDRGIPETLARADSFLQTMAAPGRTIFRGSRGSRSTRNGMEAISLEQVRESSLRMATGKKLFAILMETGNLNRAAVVIEQLKQIDPGNADRGRSRIGYAVSPDGKTWKRQSPHPVLESSLPWEGVAVMCPDVMWDESAGVWKMWYSAGQEYEPNAIGYATSRDGLQWEKYAGNPVITPDPHREWEQNRVAAVQVIRWQGWYYAFYIGFRDIDHAQIGLARSKDGITGWIRHAGNPIVRPTPGG